MTLEQAELQGTTTLVYFIYRISPMQWEMSASVRFSSYILFSFSVPNVGSRLQWEVRILRACFASFQVHFGLLGPRFKMSKA